MTMWQVATTFNEKRRERGLDCEKPSRNRGSWVRRFVFCIYLHVDVRGRERWRGLIIAVLKACSVLCACWWCSTYRNRVSANQRCRIGGRCRVWGYSILFCVVVLLWCAMLCDDL
ncbi:hypothetical protein CC80DRAFT_240260 [Byssothecium circinans]|uniref:Transmembrane protein n=1 Tax=Byssothecium circinans TaxID=147558 RepID=A0A6A5TF24_9PLEO|nr:hypothetical protein CC80DRAFT_240260 [Byssothecium circinans]